MGISTNGDQVAAHYAAAYPALFMIVRNGTPDRAPVAGDVLSMSTVPGFDSARGRPHRRGAGQLGGRRRATAR